MCVAVMYTNRVCFGVAKCVLCFGVAKCVLCFGVTKCVPCFGVTKCVPCFGVAKCVLFFEVSSFQGVLNKGIHLISCPCYPTQEVAEFLCQQSAVELLVGVAIRSNSARLTVRHQSTHINYI